MTRQVEYKGDVVSLTEALVGFPAGGQVLLSGSTYQRIYGRLHTVKFDDRVPKELFKPFIRSTGASHLPSFLSCLMSLYVASALLWGCAQPLSARDIIALKLAACSVRELANNQSNAL